MSGHSTQLVRVVAFRDVPAPHWPCRGRWSRNTATASRQRAIIVVDTQLMADEWVGGSCVVGKGAGSTTGHGWWFGAYGIRAGRRTRANLENLAGRILPIERAPRPGLATVLTYRVAFPER